MHIVNMVIFAAVNFTIFMHRVLLLSVFPTVHHSFIVFAHYLRHTWTFSNEIWYINISREYASQDQIWYWLNNFRQSYAPWT